MSSSMMRLCNWEDTHQQHGSFRTDAAVDGFSTRVQRRVRTGAGPQTRSRREDQRAWTLIDLRTREMRAVPHAARTDTTNTHTLLHLTVLAWVLITVDSNCFSLRLKKYTTCFHSVNRESTVVLFGGHTEVTLFALSFRKKESEERSM